MAKRTTFVLILVPLIITVWFSTASAETFRLTAAAGHPTTLHPIGVFKDYFIPEVGRRLAAAGGKHTMTWTQAWGGSLVKFDGVLEAVEQGIIDVGWVGTLFEEAKLPLHSVTYVTPFSCEDVAVVIKTVHVLHERVPALRQQWDKYNQVYLGSTGVDNYHLYTNFPIKNPRRPQREKAGHARHRGQFPPGDRGCRGLFSHPGILQQHKDRRVPGRGDLFLRRRA